MKCKILYLTIFAFLFFVLVQETQAQQQGGSSSGFYVDSLSRYYHRIDLPVYIRISTTPEGAGVPLSGRKVVEKAVEVKPIYLDGHGVHLLKHTDAIDPENSFQYVIHGDGRAPVSRTIYKAPNQYASAKKQYYGKGLAISVTSFDDMSGVEQLLFKLNQSEFSPYKETLTFTQEGEQTLSYYAVDRVGNVEKIKQEQFTVDLTPPTTVLNITGINDNKVVSPATRFYLFMSDSIVGVAKTFYRFDDEPWRTYTPNTVIPLDKLTEGRHTIYFYSTDFVQNQEQEQSFEFYLDRTAPIMSADILGDRFIIGNQVYFSGRTKLKLTALDNKSGIKEVLYSIDNAPFQTYQEPFYLPEKSGIHIIRYYAQDKMGNTGVYQSENANKRYDEILHAIGAVYVDLTGPVLNYRFEGKTFQKGKETFISPSTTVKIIANDTESGLQRLNYRFADQSGEENYAQSVSMAERRGKQQLELIGYDNVNNRNAINIEFVIDGEPPIINHSFSAAPIEGSDVYPSYVKLFLSAQDEATNAQTIFYSINGGSFVPYQAPLTGFKKETEYTIKVMVEDQLGNKSEKLIQFKTGNF